MSKKLLLYGLAFGSATAALSYIYLVDIVYMQNMTVHIISIFSEIILIPGLAIFFFLRAIKSSNPEQFMLGRAIFTGFFLSVIIGATVSLMFSYVVSFKPEIIARLVDYRIQGLKAALDNKTITAKDYENALGNVKNAYTTGSQFGLQLFIGASRGLFLSAIFAYFMKARTQKDY
jgi:hypothetical protein